MLGYKRQTGRWLKDLDVGLKMLAKSKLDLIPSRVPQVKENHRPVCLLLERIGMSDVEQLDFSYFPGCSLATTAAESSRS